MLYAMLVNCMINVEINCNCSMIVILMPQDVTNTVNVFVEI